MKSADVISKYLEALRSNMTEEQAQLFVKSLAESMEPHENSASKHDLELSIEKINGTIGKLQLVTYSIFLVLVIDTLKSWLF